MTDSSGQAISQGAPLGGLPSSLQLQATADFMRNYRCVTLATTKDDGAELRYRLWARLSGKVGLRVDGSGVVIPGWLFGSLEQTVAGPGVMPAPDTMNRPEVRAAIAWWSRPEVQAWITAAPIVAKLGAGRRLVAAVPATTPAVLANIRLEAGRYLVRTVPDDGDVRVFAAADGRRVALDRVTPRPLGPGPVSIEVLASKPLELAEVRLMKR